MALDSFFHNKIESMKLEIIQGQAVLRRLEAQRNDYNSRGNVMPLFTQQIDADSLIVRLLREELGLLQQPGSYVGEVVKVMGTKKVLVKVHPEGKYGMQRSQHQQFEVLTTFQSLISPTTSTFRNSPLARELLSFPIPTNSKRCFHPRSILSYHS